MWRIATGVQIQSLLPLHHLREIVEGNGLGGGEKEEKSGGGSGQGRSSGDESRGWAPRGLRGGLPVDGCAFIRKGAGVSWDNKLGLGPFDSKVIMGHQGDN